MTTTNAVIDFQAAVCRALDLDPARIQGIKLEVGVTKIRLVIEHFPTDDQLARIGEIVAGVAPEVIAGWRRDTYLACAAVIAERALRKRSSEAVPQ